MANSFLPINQACILRSSESNASINQNSNDYHLSPVPFIDSSIMPRPAGRYGDGLDVVLHTVRRAGTAGMLVLLKVAP